jgi:hypothetical protein
LKPNIVTLDIETFPNMVYTWGLFKQMVGVNQIVRDWSIASVCWKWLGQKRTEYVDCGADPHNDRDLLAEIWFVLDRADIVIGQNSKHFDIRKLNARFIEAGFGPPSPYKQIDTKVEAAKVAMFTSNRLEWLSAHLTDAPKDKHKAFPGFDLWSECLKGNPKAWAAMRKYNPRDVVATEKLYLKLRPWIVGHPNVAIYSADGKITCPKCGSHEVEHRGVYHTQVTTRQRYHCNSCRGWSWGRLDINPKEKRACLLTN